MMAKPSIPAQYSSLAVAHQGAMSAIWDIARDAVHYHDLIDCLNQFVPSDAQLYPQGDFWICGSEGPMLLHEAVQKFVEVVRQQKGADDET